MVVSYTNNNFGYTDAYKNVNNLTTNGDGGGNGGGGAFMRMFEEQEAEEAKKEKEIVEDDINPLDTLYNAPQSYYASNSTIRDYIDNSLLLNTEQVACTNITQHIALKSNVKETLKFLNIQAAKTMVNSKKRNYNSNPRIQPVLPQKPIAVKNTGEVNFFEARMNNPDTNFFIT